MEEKKAIQAIQIKLEKLDLINENKQFIIWQKETVLTLVNIYSEIDKRVKSVEEIRTYQNYGIGAIDRFTFAKEEASAILNSIITDIQNFGIISSFDRSESGKINLNLTQHNSQNQKIDVHLNFEVIFDSLKYGLSGSQIEELKEILESNQDPKDKKKSFVEKIKSFGLDAASNILANLLTTPGVYEQLGGML